MSNDEPFYPIIAEQIQDFCISILRSTLTEDDFKKISGAIVVAYYHDNKYMSVVKPLNEDNLNSIIENYICKNGTYIDNSQEKITELKELFHRAYREFNARAPEELYYFKNLKNKAHDSGDTGHYYLRDAGFRYDENGFTWPNAPVKIRKKFNVGDDNWLPWDSLELILKNEHENSQVHSSNNKQLFYHNDFDFFFMKSSDNYRFIPIPVLSSVSIWFKIALLDNEEEIINEDKLYSEIRYLILNKLIENLSVYFFEHLNSTRIKDLTTFTKEYCKILSNLLLPRAYRLLRINETLNCNNLKRLDAFQLNAKPDYDSFCDYCFFRHCIDKRNKNESLYDFCINCEVKLENIPIKCTSTPGIDNLVCERINDVFSKHLPCPVKVKQDFGDQNDIYEAWYKFNEIIELEPSGFNGELGRPRFLLIFYLSTYVTKNTFNQDNFVQDHPGYAKSAELLKMLIRNNYQMFVDMWQKGVKVQQYATKAAISQAMLRNISHNHGSHVLVNLVDAAKISQEHLDQYVNKEVNYNYFFVLEDDEKKLGSQSAIFNKFIKQRMDYLSEITFGVSNMLTSISLSEVYRDLDKNLILLNNIAGIDDFKFSINFKHLENLPLDQLFIAFPSDILGCQAFYNIIEALIRNSAKYGSGNELNHPETVFTVEFSDIPIDYDDENQFYKVEIYDNRNFISEQKLREIQDIIRMPVIDKETNELRSKGLGILEMQACAAFLRQIDVSEIDNEKYYPNEMNGLKNNFDQFPILEPFLKDNNRLGYRFYIQKPKEILFVGDWKTDSIDDITLKIQRFGINYTTTDDFIKSLEVGKTFDHQFLLYDETVNEMNVKLVSKAPGIEKKEEINVPLNIILKGDKTHEGVPPLLTILPVRMMDVTNSKDDLKKIIFPTYDTEFDFKELEEKIWMLWKDQFFERVNLNKEIVIKLISKPINTPIEETEYTICLLNHNTNNSYQACREITGIKAIEPLSSNARKKLPGWQDSYGAKINEYIDAIQKKDCQNLMFNEYKSVLIEKGLSAELNQITTYDEINQILNSKREAGTICSAVVAELKKIGASIKHKFENEETYSLTRNIIKIFEAYKNSVIVIDERIQNYAKGDYHGINNQEIYENINCYIPSKELVNLADKEMLEKQKTIIFKFIDDKIKSSEFLVVHYGLLERLYNSEEKRSLVIKNKLSEWAKSIRVVVTSGRGKHSLDLPDDVCYVNLSPVTNVFIENRSKYAINYLLNQSRR